MLRTTALAVAAAGFLVAGPAPQALAAPPAVEPAPCVREADTEAVAQQMAARCGFNVEVLDQKSETLQVWAKPNGVMSATMHNGPERFKDGNTWRNIDLTLQKRADGSIEPKGHARGLKLAGRTQSGSGETDVVSVRTAADASAERLAMTWNGALPEPVLDGEKATYPDVAPGIDLVIQASPTGFQQFLVVKTRAAVAHVANAKLGLKAADFVPETDANGTVKFKDKQGKVRAALSAPVMWDAKLDEKSGEPVNAKTLGLGLTKAHAAGAAHGIRFNADTAWMLAPEREFPVTIDPSMGSDNDTWVQKNYSSSQFGSTELKIGTSDGGNNVIARSFLRWDYAPIVGKVVLSATLNMWEHHAYSCTWADWYVYSAGYIDPNTTWPGPDPIKYYSASNDTRGHTDTNCNRGDGWVYIDAKDFLQDRTDGYPYITLNLRASETNNLAWKRFNSADAGSNRPSLSFEYTGKPTISNVKAAADCVSSCTSGTTIRTLTPQLQATATDPEGGVVNIHMELWNAAQTSLVTSQTFSMVASGTTGTWTTGALTNNTQYHLRARSNDTAGVYSDWSGWFTFTTNTAGPNLPTSLGVTADCYTSCNSPAILRTVRPNFKATVTHPYSDNMTVEFEVWNAAKTTRLQLGTKTAVPTGTTPTWQPTADLPTDQQLHLRVRSIDIYSRASAWAGWYTFTSDASVPATPTAISSLYKDSITGTYNGGAGVPGIFTFAPAGATDVVQYQWRLNAGTITNVNVTAGQSATVTITPAADLLQLLEVRSLDDAGWTSGWYSYPFLVRSQAVDVAYWKWENNTAPAVGGTKYTGTANGSPTYEAANINPANPSGSGQALKLDGTDDFVQVPRVLATDHAAGFSVSAWVKATALGTSYRTVVAQQGTNTYAFRLYYRVDSNQWCFSARDSDSVSAATNIACSSIAPVIGEWVHLAGIYDRPAGKIRLYVNGGPQNGQGVPGTMSETAVPALWAATGAFRIGRSDSGSYWSGSIDEVRAYQRAVPEVEVRQMFLDCLVGNCPSVPPATDPIGDCVNTASPMCIGEWKLDEGAGTTASDSSDQENTLTLSGSAAFTANGYDGTPGITLDGTGYTATAGPVVITDQAFTVSAWVKPDQLTADVYLMQQSGTAASSFVLGYNHAAAKWQFSTTSHNGSWHTWHTAYAPAAPKIGVWTHLAGVYDPAAHEVRVYVNGQLAATMTGASAQPSLNAPLYVGGQTWGATLDGTIDMVRAYQGGMTGAQIASLYADELAPPNHRAWWELEDGDDPPLYDLTEHGNHGTLSATGTSFVTGHDGTAVEFDGLTGAATANTTALQSNDSFTVAAWVYLSATSASEQWVLAQCGSLGSAFKLYRSPSSGKWAFQVQSPDGSGGLTAVKAESNAAAQTGEWVHLAGVFDAATGAVQLYVGGSLQTTAGTGAAGYESAYATTVGAGLGAGGYGNYFTGIIDSVHLYQGALNGTQVQQVRDGQEL